MFNTGAMVLLIGAIIPVIGEVLKLVAWILVAVGFFNIRTSIRVSEAAVVVSTSEEKRFCQYCGAQIQPDASFCWKCGEKTS
jgi:ribosomal protein L40E